MLENTFSGVRGGPLFDATQNALLSSLNAQAVLKPLVMLAYFPPGAMFPAASQHETESSVWMTQSDLGFPPATLLTAPGTAGLVGPPGSVESPQQASVLSSRTPHTPLTLANMLSNVPLGGLVRPLELLPQHAIVSSDFTPQLTSTETATFLNVPLGGLDSPLSFLPQQVTVPSTRTAHAWLAPAATFRKVPLGATFCPNSLALPQHDRVRSVRT